MVKVRRHVRSPGRHRADHARNRLPTHRRYHPGPERLTHMNRPRRSPHFDRDRDELRREAKPIGLLVHDGLVRRQLARWMAEDAHRVKPVQRRIALDVPYRWICCPRRNWPCRTGTPTLLRTCDTSGTMPCSPIFRESIRARCVLRGLHCTSDSKTQRMKGAMCCPLGSSTKTDGMPQVPRKRIRRPRRDLIRKGNRRSRRSTTTSPPISGACQGAFDY